MALELLLAALICFALGALAALLSLRSALGRYLSAAAATVGSLVLVVDAIVVLGGRSGLLLLPASTPLGGFEVRLGPLSGLFLLLTGLVGIAISLYSAEYAVRVGGPPRQAAMLCLYNLTMASLAVLLTAGNALTFLLAWEAMSILTYVLVAVDYDHPGVPEAAFLMLAISELGFVAITVGFALVGAFQPGHDFAAITAAGPGAGVRNAAFLLFLFGFGAKAGLLPLQGWLPEAHPAAPSNISALLSAVIVKMAIYGLLVTLISLLGRPPVWWGYLALGLGVVTAIYGVLFSLLEHDLKRALAYSTIENLGFMVGLIGAALLFRSLGNQLLEALTLVTVLLHALNHALLKGVLFLGAGSAQAASGTRDMDQLGGLWRKMRWSALAFFIGAAGLAGIPPLNGFQSEWLGLQMLLQSHLLHDRGARLAMAGSGALIALTFGLAVTTFIRMFGGVFLGAPRTPEAEAAVESPPAMVAGMNLLAAASVVLGLLPPLGLGAAAAASEALTGRQGVLDAVLPPIFKDPARYTVPVKLGATFLSQVLPVNGLVIVPGDPEFSSIAPTYIFLTLAFVIGFLALALRVLGAGAGRQAKKVWVGGIPAYRVSMQYTPTGFTNPLRFIFGTVYRSTREIEGDYHQAPFFARSVRYTHRFIEPVETYVYFPLASGARALSERLSFLQGGNVSVYLVYLFAVFLIALFVR